MLGLCLNRFRPYVALVILSMVLNCQSVQSAEGNQVYIPIRVLSRIDITPDDVKRVEQGVSVIPPAIQKFIAAAGIEVVLTPQMNFEEPEHSGEKLFRNGGTYDNLGGVFESGKKRVVIPEKASWRNSPPRPQGNSIVRTCRHELGHAWDFAQGKHSHSEGYIAAYDQDFRKLSNEQCRKWAYYITGVSTGDANVPTASGRAECFASVFAALVTPPSQRVAKMNELLQDFPNVARNLQSLDSDLGRITESPSPGPFQSTSNLPIRSGSQVSPANKAKSDECVKAANDFMSKQEYQRAVNQLSEAIKFNPNDPNSYLLRGNGLSWLKKYNLAILDYTLAIKLSPTYAAAYEMRARAYGWLGQKRLQDADELLARKYSIKR